MCVLQGTNVAVEITAVDDSSEEEMQTAVVYHRVRSDDKYYGELARKVSHGLQLQSLWRTPAAAAAVS